VKLTATTSPVAQVPPIAVVEDPAMAPPQVPERKRAPVLQSPTLPRPC